MELKSRLPSTLVNEQQPDEVNRESESDDIKWETEISFEDAYKALEEKLYGFKKVRPVLYLLWCYKTYLLHSKKVLLSSSLYTPVIPGWLVLQRLQSCCLIDLQKAATILHQRKVFCTSCSLRNKRN